MCTNKSAAWDRLLLNASNSPLEKMGQTQGKEYIAVGVSPELACQRLERKLCANVHENSRVMCTDPIRMLSPRAVSQLALARVHGRDYKVTLKKMEVGYQAIVVIKD